MSNNLLTNRKFWPLCLTQFFGAFNDNFFKNALIILITFQSLEFWTLSAEQLIALAGGVFIFPFFLFSALAGQIADKYEKARWIVYIKILECFVMVLASIGFLTNNLLLLLLALFLMGLQSTLFSPLKYSYMPRQVARDQLISANGYLQATTFLAILLGTSVGGFVIAFPEQGVFYTSLGIFILAGIGLFFSFFILKVPSLTPLLIFQYNPFTSTWRLIRYIFLKKQLLYTTLGLAWFWFYGATVLTLLPGYGKKILGGDEQVVTFLLTLFSIGIGLGCMTCKKISRKGLNLSLAPIGALGLSLFLGDLSLQNYLIGTRSSPVSLKDFITNIKNFRVIFDLIMIAFSGGLLFVPLMTFLQIISPKEHLSRVISAGNIFDAFFMVLSAGSLILLFYLGLTSVDIFFLLTLINLICAFLIYWFSKTAKKSI